MWRAGITKLNGDTEGKNFQSKEEAEIWVLEQADTGITYSIIVNKDNMKERFGVNWIKDK